MHFLIIVIGNKLPTKLTVAHFDV